MSSALLLLMVGTISNREAGAQENVPDITGKWELLAGAAGRIVWTPVGILHKDEGDTLCHRVATGEIWIYRRGGPTPGSVPSTPTPLLPTPTQVSGTQAPRPPAGPGTYVLDVEASHLQRTQLNPKLPEDVRKDLVQRKLWTPQAVITAQPDGTLQVVWSDDEVRYNKESGTVSDIYPRSDAPQRYAKRARAAGGLPTRYPIPGTFPFRYGPGPAFLRWPLNRPLDPFGGWQPSTVRVGRNGAFDVLQNMLEGKDPFRATKGGVNWSTLTGDPYPGRIEDDPAAIDLPQLFDPSGTPDAQFSSAQLDQRYVEARDQLAMDSLQRYLDAYKAANPNDPDAAGFKLSKSKFDLLQRLGRNQAEPEMWNQLGQAVANTDSGVGIVDLRDSRFSFANATGEGGQFLVPVGRDGQFILIRDNGGLTVPGGAQTVMDAIRTQTSQPGAIPLTPEQTAALDQAASKLLWAGRVRTGFRYVGRAGLAFGAVYDGYRFYKSDDKLKTGVETAGGWTGAVLAGEAFAIAWTPADVAGPGAWLLHGLGTLFFGGLGYFGGSTVTGWIVDEIRGNPCAGLI